MLAGPCVEIGFRPLKEIAAAFAQQQAQVEGSGISTGKPVFRQQIQTARLKLQLTGLEK